MDTDDAARGLDGGAADAAGRLRARAAALDAADADLAARQAVHTHRRNEIAKQRARCVREEFFSNPPISRADGNGRFTVWRCWKSSCVHRRLTKTRLLLNRAFGHFRSTTSDHSLLSTLLHRTPAQGRDFPGLMSVESVEEGGSEPASPAAVVGSADSMSIGALEGQVAGRRQLVAQLDSLLAQMQEQLIAASTRAQQRAVELRAASAHKAAVQATGVGDRRTNRSALVRR
jgi:hypothetical protein